MDNKKDLNNFEHASDDWYKGKVVHEDTAKGLSRTKNPLSNEQNRESVPNNKMEFSRDYANDNVANNHSEQEKSSFEFGQDNYINPNNHRGRDDRNTVDAFKNQVNVNDDVDFEFGQDYFPHSGVNSENNREHESKKNSNQNNRTL